jgi:AGCS family alanine or glycine:cation symporter
VFQANQTVQLLRESFALPMGWIGAEDALLFNLLIGGILAALTAVVIAGRIQRIGRVAVRLVPAMVLFYFALTLIVIAAYWQQVPSAFALIFSDAFSGSAVAGGALGAVIQTGISRGAFSNEAGIGTESMAHGAAKTREPIREGVVAMLGPIVDTLIICTCTALVILLTGVWQQGGGIEGVTLTANGFTQVFGGYGAWLLLLMVVPLAFSTIVANWYYGVKCLNFLLNAQCQKFYTPIYLLLIVLGAAASLSAVNSIIIGMYAVMAVPTMTSTLWLAGRVNTAAKKYFAELAREKGTAEGVGIQS